jgi:hypothetical protein
MNANSFEEQRTAQLNQALKDYETAKQNYQRLVRQAISETDAQKRRELIQTVEVENNRLVQIVQGILGAIEENKTMGKTYSEQKVIDLNKELARFKEEVEYIRGKNDTVIQLRELLASVSNETNSERRQYYGFIVGILVLLIVVFIFFVYSYASSVINAVTETVSTVTAPMTQAIE